MTEADSRQLMQAAKKCCGKLGCPPSDLDDAIQEVMLRRLKTDKGWNLRHACIDAMRSLYGKSNSWRRKGLDMQVPYVDMADPRGSDPAEIAETKEESELFLARLTDRQRQVLKLRREGWTAKEIAAKIGGTYQAVFQTLKEIKAQWAEKTLREKI